MEAFFSKYFPRCPRTAMSVASLLSGAQSGGYVRYKPWYFKGSGRWFLSCALQVS